LGGSEPFSRKEPEKVKENGDKTSKIRGTGWGGGWVGGGWAGKTVGGRGGGKPKPPELIWDFGPSKTFPRSQGCHTDSGAPPES